MQISVDKSHYEETNNRKIIHGDDVWSRISLNMLARYEAYGLTAKEAIESTLITLEDRAAYYERLSYRLSHVASGGAYSSCFSMIQRIDEEFGSELKAMWTEFQATRPGPPIQAPMAPCNARNSSRFNWLQKPRQANPNGQRCFFPENDLRSNQPRGMLKANVRNIDWQLASAVQQVVSLSLDGSQPQNKTGIASYNPPSPMQCQAA